MCKTCGKNIDANKSRPFPEPDMMQEFLVINTEFSGQICPEDRVCYACYRSHLFVIKHIQNCIRSTDSHLSTLIDKIKEEIPNPCNIQTYDSALQYAASISAIQVGEVLLNQTAILLPEVYDNFIKELMRINEQYGITINQDHPSPTWLRSQVSSLLEHHMAYRCVVKRYGTLLYRYGGDLVAALSVSL